MSSSSARDIANGARSSTRGCTWRMAAVTPSAGVFLSAATRPRLRALFCHPLGPMKSTSLRAASSTVSAWRAWSSISFQASSVMGARLRSRSFMLVSGGSALEATDAEGSVRVAPARAATTTVLHGGLLAADDRSFGEEIGAERHVELRIVTAEPLERHGGVLLLLVTVVGEDLAELVVLAGVDALIVPVDRLELLAQRRGGAGALDGLLFQQLGVFVQPHTRRHERPPLAWVVVHAGAPVNPSSLLFELLPDRVQLLASIDNVGVEVSPAVGGEPRGAAVEHDERLHGGRLAERVGNLLQQVLDRGTVGEVLPVLGLHGERQVMDHVGHALCVIEVVVVPPRCDAAAVRLVGLEQVGVRVVQEIAPGLHEPDELDVAPGDRLRSRRG